MLIVVNIYQKIPGKKWVRGTDSIFIQQKTEGVYCIVKDVRFYDPAMVILEINFLKAEEFGRDIWRLRISL